MEGARREKKVEVRFLVELPVCKKKKMKNLISPQLPDSRSIFSILLPLPRFAESFLPNCSTSSH